MAAVLALLVGLVYFRQPKPTQAPQDHAGVVSADAPSVRPERPAGRAAAVSGPGPTRVVAGIPMGYSHDRVGAKAAAAGFVRALGSLVAMDGATAEAAQRAMATEAASEALVAETVEKLAQLAKSWPPGSVSYRAAPVAVRVVEEGPDAVRAEVWYVGVVSAPDLPTYEEWVTEGYRLVWERDDWRMAAHTSRPGPRPDPGRQRGATPAEIEAALVGFEAL